ncbi:MAG: alpha/beta fold hydrolase [Sandaracinaceae bacterium]|nr:alpha/beta fold hydrolase [Sandaracinaceae bacterium]
MPVTPSSPRLAYRIHGTEGPPILLIMGLAMRGVVWRPQVEDLERDHRLLTFDNRGIGESEAAPGRWTMADMADDAQRVLDTVGWDSAHVVGVSMGGMVAQELALRAPGRLRSLTLIATHAGGPVAIVPPLAGLAGFLATNLLPDTERYGALAKLLYPDEFLRVVDRDALLSRMRDHVGVRPPARTRNEQVLAVMRHDTRARLARLEVPTMVVTSERDALVSPKRQHDLLSRIPRARHVSFDRAGHGVIFQCAPVLNGHIRRHVSEHEPILPHVQVHA